MTWRSIFPSRFLMRELLRIDPITVLLTDTRIFVELSEVWWKNHRSHGRPAEDLRPVMICIYYIQEDALCIQGNAPYVRYPARSLYCVLVVEWVKWQCLPHYIYPPYWSARGIPWFTRFWLSDAYSSYWQVAEYHLFLCWRRNKDSLHQILVRVSLHTLLVSHGMDWYSGHAGQCWFCDDTTWHCIYCQC